MAINPNPGPMLVPIVSECFTKAMGPVSAALRAAGHPNEAGSLAYTAGIVEEMSSTAQFDAPHARRVLDVANQLPALHGSQDLADLYDLVRLIEEQDLPEWQRSKQPVPCLERARRLEREGRRATSGPNELR